jgi:hypothetical protein
MTALIACPVCFGASDAPMAVATNMGIFVMLGVVAVMLASFAGFFVYLNRRATALAGNGSAEADAEGSGRGRTLETNPQEGTA